MTPHLIDKNPRNGQVQLVSLVRRVIPVLPAMTSICLTVKL